MRIAPTAASAAAQKPSVNTVHATNPAIGPKLSSMYATAPPERVTRVPSSAKHVSTSAMARPHTR